MATTVAVVGDRATTFEAKSATCGGFQVNTILDHGMVRWISIASISRALPGIEQYPQWQRFLLSKTRIKISFGDNPPFDCECISKRDFFDAALTHKDSDAFRSAVAEVCEKFDDNGLAVSSRFANNPIVQLFTAGLQTALKVAELAEQVAEVKAGHELVAKKADSAYNLAETSLELQITRNGRLRAIPELSRRGWKIDEGNFGNVGGELTRISLRIGDDPRAPENQCQWRNDLVHTYIEQAFTLWEKECGPKYQRKQRKP